MQTGKIQRVFILDENVDDAKRQQEIIEDCCASAIVHSCRTAYDGLRYLKLYPTIPIDLVLMDVDQLRCGGREFLEFIETQSKPCTFAPVVIMMATTNEKLDLSRNQYAPLVADYIHKPVVPEFFLYLLEFHFDREGMNTVKGPVAGS